MNPDVGIETVEEVLMESNIESLIPEYDIIVDALDNLEKRHLHNRLAVKRRIPLIHGAVTGYDGQVTTIIHRRKIPAFTSFSSVFPNKEFSRF